VAALSWVSKCALHFLPRSTQTLDAEEKLKAEIRGTLDLDKGTALAQEQSMLKSVLDLDDVTVEDVMQHRSHIVSLNIATSPKDIFTFISQTPFSRIPLWKGRRDNIVGVLHVKAVLKMMTRAENERKKLNILDYCAKPWFILNTTNLMDQLHAFKKRREHFALVVNEYGDLQGLVTLEDVLEEIVGDISDENDKPEESILQPTKTESGAWRVDGSTTIRDLNRHFKWELPDENATTIAGLVLYLAERIPKEGKTFMLGGFTFVVAGREGNRLTYIDILPPAH
jgi:Mg2+/Co2+ transporter CorB